MIVSQVRDAGLMVERYPAVEPDESGLLDVGAGSSLYWESVGNPAGVPVVYLHGGREAAAPLAPGSISTPSLPRGVGRPARLRSQPSAGSNPDADLSTNTTTHLVADIERLREHLHIDR